MILSHDWRFVFLKTRKTAGTSVEIALSRICGPLDVITSISPIDQALRYRDSGVLPRNYLLGGMPAPPPSAIPEQHFMQNMKIYQPHAQFLNHLTASEVRALVGKRVWKSYFRFTIERDPFQRLESQYFWRIQSEERPIDFSAWLHSELPLSMRNAAVYFDGDELAVDFVVDYARLAEDLALVAEVMGWPDLGSLPRAKSHTRRGRRIDWSAADRAFVEQTFAAELSLYAQVSEGFFRDRLRAMSAPGGPGYSGMTDYAKLGPPGEA